MRHCKLIPSNLFPLSDFLQFLPGNFNFYMPSLRLFIDHLNRFHHSKSFIIVFDFGLKMNVEIMIQMIACLFVHLESKSILLLSHQITDRY